MAEYRQIPGLELERLSNATHKEAMDDVTSVSAENSIPTYLPEAYAELRAAVQAENAALAESLKSQYTEAITQKDVERDSALVMAKTAMRDASVNGSSSAKQAAQYLMMMSKLQKITAATQYDKETGEISTAVDELLGVYLSYTEQAGIKNYVVALKRLNDEMCELLQLRDAERGEQGKSKVAKSRQESDKAYRELVRQVNALEIAFAIGQLQGQPEDDPFTPFINFMLGLIDRYKREILNRKKPDKEETVTDEVTEEVTQTPDGEETTETDTETDTETTLTPDTRTKKK